MASLSPRTEWVLSISNKELALICRGLRGDLQTEDLQQEALKLCDQLTEMRATGLHQVAKDGERIATHLENARKERGQ